MHSLKISTGPCGGGQSSPLVLQIELSQIWGDKLSSEPFSASYYRRLRALRDLILYEHTLIFPLSKGGADAYSKKFIWPPEGGSKVPRETKSIKLSRFSV